MKVVLMLNQREYEEKKLYGYNDCKQGNFITICRSIIHLQRIQVKHKNTFVEKLLLVIQSL